MHFTAIFGEYNKSRNAVTRKRAKLENNAYVQKQPPEVFYETNRRTPVLESLFKKVVPAQLFSCEFCKILKNICTVACKCRFQQQ